MPNFIYFWTGGSSLFDWPCCIYNTTMYDLVTKKSFSHNHLSRICKPSGLFLTSLTSVRVFTRMVSDNPWSCSLWVPSSQSCTSKFTIIFSYLHIHEQTSLTEPDFWFFFLKFSKLLKSAPTDQSATSLLGLCGHFAQFTRFEGEGHKCSQFDVEKIQTVFLFSKIAVFLMYKEIYISMYLWSSNSSHSILVSVLCKKIKQYCLKFHAAWDFF